MSDQSVRPSQSSADLKRQTEAEEALRRVRHDSESIGSSALARRETVHSDEDDRIEVWGRRIGRGLGAIAVLLILWQLASMLLGRK